MVVRYNSWILRDRVESDEGFLARCFASARGGTFAALPEPIRSTLMAQQRQAFERSLSDYPDLLDRVVELDGVPVGRVIESRSEAAWCLVDVALSEEAQGHGIGSAVLERMLSEARAAGACIRLHVRLGHRAVAWYQRLGFEEVSRDELDIEMRAL